MQGVELVVLPSGLHLIRLPTGDQIHVRQLPSGGWKATARAKVRMRVGRPYTYLLGSCHPGYHRSLAAAIQCAEKAMPRLHAHAEAFRAATAPRDREALGRMRKRRIERVGPNWQAMRRRVLAEQPLCPCGVPSEHVDHIVPVVRGGTSERDNLQALCRACHEEKTSRDFPPRRTNI